MKEEGVCSTLTRCLFADRCIDRRDYYTIGCKQPRCLMMVPCDDGVIGVLFLTFLPRICTGDWCFEAFCRYILILNMR